MLKTNLINSTKLNKCQKKKSVHIVESSFNPRFLELLKKTLPSGVDFLKKTRVERLMVNEKFDQAITQESNWKNLIRKSHFSAQIIKDNLGLSLVKFCKYGNDRLFPPVGTTSKERVNYASSKAENFLHGVFLFLVSENQIILADKFDIKSVNFRKISETMDLEHLFVLLTGISMGNVYRSCISSNQLVEADLTNSTGTGFYLYAKRTNIQYSFNNCFQNYLIVLLLGDLRDNKEVSVLGFVFKAKENDAVRDKIITKQFGEVKKLIDRKTHEISNQSWFIETFSACYSFLCVLKKTPMILTTFNFYDKKNHKQNKIYQFDPALQSMLDSSKLLPKIIRPTNHKTNDCLKNSVKTSNLGTKSMVLNDRIRRAANLIQSKCFIINQEYFSILQDCESIDQKKLSESPFPTQLEFSDLSAKFQEWDMNPLAAVRYSQEFKSKIEMHKKLRIMKNKRQLFLTAVDAAHLFSGYPLYYSTKLDYRLRMYPLEFLLSRTSGYLKRTLKDFSPQKLSINGLIHLLQAYYSFNKPQREIFDRYLEKGGSLVKKPSKKKLKLFFEKNPLNYAGKQLAYSTMLSRELSRIFLTTGKMSTQIWLEVDQNASAFTFLALLFENKKMAKATGLIPNSTGTTPDIYSLIRDNIRSYVKTKYKGDLKNTENLLIFLCDNEGSRKLHKLAAMCWVFNEGKRSRIRKWLERFKELNNRSLTDSEYNLLNWIGKEYPLIIDNIFPNLSRQKDLINQAVKLLIKNTTETEMETETLDGGLLGWDFHPRVNTRKPIWNPITKIHDSVKQNRAPSLSKKKSPNSENWLKKQKLIGEKYRLTKHLSTFIPNLIQSMDGAALRILVLTVYDKVKYVMNPLHDCFMVTPNCVDALGEAIVELYSGPELAPNLADRLFFESLAKKLHSSDREELDRIKSEFNELKTPFFVDKTALDPWKLYSYEN